MKIRCLLGLAIGLFALTGCQTENVPPTAEPTTIVDMPTSTATAVPNTPTPSPTPEPTATATAVPLSETQPLSDPDSALDEASAQSALPFAEAIELGNEMLFKSKWNLAEEMFLQAIDAEPENPEGYARLAYLYVYRPETKSAAVEFAEQAFTLAPDDSEVAAYLVLALTANGRFDEATPLAENIVSLAYDKPFVQAVVADLYLKTGRHDEAQSLINQAIALDSIARVKQWPDIYRIQLAKLVSTQDFGSAIASSFGYVSHFPEFAPAYYSQAWVYEQAGRPGRISSQIVADGLAIDPNFVPLLVISAKLFDLDGDLIAAQNNCERIIEILPESPDGYVCTGMVYLSKGDYETALASYDSALSLDPNAFEAYLGRGQVFFQQDDCEQAKVDWTAVTELNPYSVEGWASLGLANICLEEMAAAATAVEQAIGLNPQNPEPHYTMGTLYLQTNEYRLAEAEFQLAIELSPQIQNRYLKAFGESLIGQGICPTDVNEDLAAYLCAGKAMLNAEENLLAVNAFAAALEFDLESTIALENSVLAYANLGMCELAENHLERLLAIQGENALATNAYDECVTNEIALNTYRASIPQEQMLPSAEAIDLALDAALQIPGVEDAQAWIEYNAEVEDNIFYFHYISAYSFPSDEFNTQLRKVVAAVTEGFVLSDEYPYYLVVWAHADFDETPEDGFMLSSRVAVSWYLGYFSDEVFQANWWSLADLLE